MRTIRDDAAGLELSASAMTGGELSSFRVLWKDGWVELIDRAQAFGEPPLGRWRGRAPWLFPAVGRSRGGVWRWGETERRMPIHGFMIDRPWKLGSTAPDRLTFRLDSAEDTRASYPFDFDLTATYAFTGSGVRATLEVGAGGRNVGFMPFSVGNHVTLALPFGSASLAGDCVLRTPARERWELSSESLLTGKRTQVSLADGAPLGKERWLLDAVLGGYSEDARWVELSDPASFAVRVSQRPVSGHALHSERFFFVLWGDLGHGFFCPEPWYGGPDSLNERRGVVELEPGGRFAWEWELQILR